MGIGVLMLVLSFLGAGIEANVAEISAVVLAAVRAPLTCDPVRHGPSRVLPGSTVGVDRFSVTIPDAVVCGPVEAPEDRSL